MDFAPVAIGIIGPIIGFVIGFLLLAAVIRYGVRRGIEDALYSKGKDGLWAANPWIVAIAKEIVETTRKPGSGA